MKKAMSLVLVGLMLIGSMSLVFAGDYTVKSGDVLWKIAKDHETSVDQLMDMNDIENGDLIYPGQVLKVENEVMEMTNGEKAVALIESIGTSNSGPVAYINPEKYIQHNLGAADGLEGFAALASILPEGSYGKNIRVFEDGDYVFMHNEYNFFGPKAAFDIFRFENGLIVEHWDNLSPIAEDVNPSGRGQLDGTKVLKDLQLTDSNKALVEGFIGDILMGGARDKITDYISTDQYFQHNTGVADGLEGLGEAMAALAEAGMPIVYSENHMVLGQGNFVLAVSEGQFLGKHVSFYDLFRIENGKIVEHWDVIETIPEQSQWKNDNGKF